ncbi:Glutathione S-transferase [Ectocarpus siliculosus]|uniref:Glutathione S-transferase n=1 Tax=Ectocarpus siliculosus TaxID=2880 RepID=D7G5G1_ECTSI|nr:Glutathione S-transferase [Ectocarpus siliculosus]|eukprot:CBJ33855.1 Glutathione S-transferase [Ectocarpus siliculosus]
MPSTATLHYFDDPGRAEATRVALAYAGKDFEDNIMGFPEYGASKWAGIGLPVLEMDDAEYTQSTALLRYAGKLGGLYPDDALAALKVDEIVMIAEDVMANMFKCVDQKDDTMANGLLEGKIKTLVEMLTSRLAANASSKFFVGHPPTIADLQARVHAVIKNFEANFLTGLPTTHIADTAPTLMEMQAALLEDPKPITGEGVLRFQGVNIRRMIEEKGLHPLATVGMAEDI